MAVATRFEGHQGQRWLRALSAIEKRDGSGARALAPTDSIAHLNYEGSGSCLSRTANDG